MNDEKCGCGGSCACGDHQRLITAELNLGNACNFRCEYCFEAGHYEPQRVQPEVVDKFIDLGKTIFEHGHHFHISFWGGEPMMYMDEVYKVVDALKDYDGVEFLLYTNGWFIEQHKQRLASYISTLGKKLVIQVSHDFLPPERSHRVLPGVDGRVVEQRVLDAIRWLDEVDATYVIKTTGTLADLEHNLFEQYIRFMKFRETLKHKDDVTMGYTPDTTDPRATDKELLGQQLSKLLVYFAQNQTTDPRFNWFYGSRATCAAGNSSFFVDVNGDVTYCHGCLYYPKQPELIDEIRFTNIFDENVLFKIEHNVVARNSLWQDNAQCNACDALMCFRCNALNCRGDVARWDTSNVENTCETYRFISRYIRAYQVMREKWAATNV